MPRVSGTESTQGGHGWGRVYCRSLALTTWPAPAPGPSAKPSVLPFSLGHLFHTPDEKQSLGRVYGYFPPNCQSWFTISGDKVWQPLPPQEGSTTENVSLAALDWFILSQAMGKLGTSLSSGRVMVNGTQTQVLLVGAPTHGRSSPRNFASFQPRGSLTTFYWSQIDLSLLTNRQRCNLGVVT